jgi:alanine racemase
MTAMIDSPLAAVYALPGRSTRAIIDLDALSANVAELRRIVAPPTALMAVVKADGYGHGAIMVSRCALAAGASMLGVATVGEAADLRKHQITAPILLLGPTDPSEIERALALDVEITIADPTALDAVGAAATALGKTARVHLKIDSGMHRFGATPRDALALIDQFADFENVDLVAVCTHFAAADEPEHPATGQQSAVFEQAAAQLRSRLGRPLAVHSANSAATLRGMAANDDIARCGIAMYGLAPGPQVPLPDAMQPVLSVTSRLSRVHRAAVPCGVGYGQTYVPECDETLGLVPVGYADGYHRALSGKASVQIGLSRCPVRGHVCMDQTIVGDVPDGTAEDALVGVAGPFGGGPGFDELAALAGTIPYELVAGLSHRIPRYYVANDRVVATLIEGVLDSI